MRYYQTTLKRVAPFRLWIFVVLALTTIPYLLAMVLAPDGHQFLGALINPGDLNVYLSAIRQGAEGKWLFEVQFTAENMTPKLTYPFYLALGRLGYLLSIDPLWLFHGSRVLAGLLLLVSLIFWLDYLGIDINPTHTFILIFLSGGWGWLALLGGWVLPDVHVAEWLPFLSVFHAPHFALGIFAEILVMTGLLMAYRAQSGGLGGKMTAVMLVSIGALGQSLLYPYRIVPLAGVIGLFTLVELVKMRKGWLAQRWLIISSFWGLLILSIMGLYYAFVARADPFWETTHVVQNSIPSPHPVESFLAWGMVGIFALLAFKEVLRRGWWQTGDALRLCLVWFGVGVVCLYLPVSFQGRFALNIFLPLAVVGAWGLKHQVLDKVPTANSRVHQMLGKNPRESMARVLLLLAFPSIIVFVGMSLGRMSVLPEQYFILKTEVQAAEWLANHMDEGDLVLVGPQVGNYLPSRIHGRVFVGQYYITVAADEKTALVRQFFQADTSNEWREQFLEEWGIEYIYYGYAERQVGPPPQLPGWGMIYENDDVMVYGRIG